MKSVKMGDREDSRPQVQAVTVDAERAGQRIDNFLLNYLKGVPRSRIYRLLRTGQVRVNKGRIRPVYRLKAGDTIRIPPVAVAAPEQAPAIPRGALEAVGRAVLYEDEDLLVLDKPAGMAAHGGSGLRYGVIEVLRALRPHAPDIALVHRLDRQTSGCLLAAKNRRLLPALQARFMEGEVDKRYLALLKGVWRGGPRTIDLALRKGRLQSGERMVAVDTDGKMAQTRFTPVASYGQCCLVEATLHTGRTHQIRVHAAGIGQPVAGDDKYGDAEFNRAMRRLGLKRLFLHAHALSFAHPASGRSVDVSAPLAEDLRKVLDELEKREA